MIQESGVSINEKQSLFSIKNGDGYTTMGFQHVYDTLNALIKRGNLKDFEVKESEIGTIQQYNQYTEAFGKYAKLNRNTTWHSPNALPAVKKIIDEYMHIDIPLRIFYGDVETGRDFLEECDVIGKIGRSTGVFKTPILVTKDGYGGPALLEDIIIKIMRADTGQVLWTHKNYQKPTFDIQKKESMHEVYVNGSLQASFKNVEEAANFISFLSGNSMHSPCDEC